MLTVLKWSAFYFPPFYLYLSNVFLVSFCYGIFQLVGSIPGVDPNDPAIKDAMKKDKKDGDKKE